MASILVRDLSPELEAALHAYASRHGLSINQAAIELMLQGIESAPTDSGSVAGVKVRDYLAETIKEALHTKDEAEEFVRSHE